MPLALPPTFDLPLALSLTNPTHLGLVVVILLAVLVIAAAYALLNQPRKFRRHGTPWWRQVAWGAGGGAIVGGVAIAATSPDHLPHTDAPTLVICVVTLVTITMLGVVTANFWRTPILRRILAGTTAVVLVLAAAVAVNVDRIGTRPAAASTTATRAPGETLPLLPQFPQPAAKTTTATATVAPTPDLTRAGYAVASTLYLSWRPPAGMPSAGRLETVTIPGTVSHFIARPAEVYLPPAALVKNAPQLPVVILLSGQPASPDSVAYNGHTVATLNTLAARNHGLAPIVVIPDQLGQPQNNPMCVNGVLGNVKTYIMTDVTSWIRVHLHVMPQRDAWAIGGFSEGGTCSIQFATEFPTLFGSLIDVSGEQYPTQSTDTAALRDDFQDNQLLYDRAKPESVMDAHGPYADMIAVFAVGSEDKHYGPIMQLMSAAAASHGIHISRYVSEGTGHDWTTASNGFAAGLGTLYQRFGLADSGQFVTPYTTS